MDILNWHSCHEINWDQIPNAFDARLHHPICDPLRRASAGSDNPDINIMGADEILEFAGSINRPALDLLPNQLRVYIK